MYYIKEFISNVSRFPNTVSYTAFYEWFPGNKIISIASICDTWIKYRIFMNQVTRRCYKTSRSSTRTSRFQTSWWCPWRNADVWRRPGKSNRSRESSWCNVNQGKQSTNFITQCRHRQQYGLDTSPLLFIVHTILALKPPDRDFKSKVYYSHSFPSSQIMLIIHCTIFVWKIEIS